MIKTALLQLSKGIFYTIGRIIAYFLIGLLIYFILSKLGVSYETLY